MVVRDEGIRHQIWKDMINEKRLEGANRQGVGHGSSHYGGAGDQWEVHLPSLGCVLFGKHPAGHSWFQNESWAAWRPGAFSGTVRWLAHGALGFGMHKWSGNKQVGAYGYSIHTEKNTEELVVDEGNLPKTDLYLAPLF